MNEFSWIPGTVVLSAGLVVGLVFAVRLRRPVSPAKRSGGKKAAAGPVEARRADDVELRLADLEARRDELYARLRGEGARELDEGDLRNLELAAARTLRDLDQVHAELRNLRPEKAKSKGGRKGAAPVAAPVAVPAAMHHPFLWFAMGAGLMGLVGALVFWAQQDAKPDPMAAQSAPPPASASADHPAEGLDALSPEVRQHAEVLQAQLAADPTDLASRKELAVLLAQHQQFFAAFQHANVILESSPNDPDALYISGVVRVTMGQAEDALTLLDRVLAQFPDHTLAHLVRGTALLQLEQRDEALAAWQSALQAAGGSNPQIEGMIASEFGGGASTATAAAASSTAAPPMARVDTGGPKLYRVYAEVPSGTVVPPGSSLFVSVHDPGGGPPAAVRAVRDPKFPVEVTLTQDDSNTGIPLPARGLIMLRLDSDGNPGTESPSDLAARGEGTSGELAKFVLW